MTIAEYQTRKKKIETLEKEVTRAEGSMETLLLDLKKNFNIETLDGGGKLLEKYIEEESELTKEIESKLTKLDSITDWGSV